MQMSLDTSRAESRQNSHQPEAVGREYVVLVPLSPWVRAAASGDMPTANLRFAFAPCRPEGSFDNSPAIHRWGERAT